MKLKDFLASKPLFYKEIDYQRMPKAFESIKDRLSLPKIIHIVGTNGKGSTGRFLAFLLLKNGFKVGHYTSPHILRFNERIWLNGKDIDEASLEKAHKELFEILPNEFKDSLSYFEYTTLLAIKAFENVDFAILEAGLGGEFDGTNVFKKELSIISTIGFDHQSFLGEKIEDIALTKIRSIDKNAILGYQKYQEVIDVAKKVAKEKGANLFLVDELLDENEKEKIKEFIKAKAFPSYFIQNLSLAYAAAKFLKVKPNLEQIKDIEIFGRFQRVLKNVIIDVGHNPLSAKEIVKNIKKDIVLVYNTYEDKDYKEILKILKPKIKRVEIIDIDDERVVKKEILKSALKELKINYCDFKEIRKSEEYLVYGSFKVVERFLKEHFAS